MKFWNRSHAIIGAQMTVFARPFWVCSYFQKNSPNPTQPSNRVPSSCSRRSLRRSSLARRRSSWWRFRTSWILGQRKPRSTSYIWLLTACTHQESVEKKYTPWNIEVPGIAKIISQTRLLDCSLNPKQSISQSKSVPGTARSASAFACLYRHMSDPQVPKKMTVPYCTVCLFRSSSGKLVSWQPPCHGSHSTHRLSWHLGTSELLNQKNTTKNDFHLQIRLLQPAKNTTFDRNMFVTAYLSCLQDVASILANVSKRKYWTDFHLECFRGLPRFAAI